ncbi:hypothetical protein ABIC29_002415 [Agromyces sp. PvR057]
MVEVRRAVAVGPTEGIQTAFRAACDGVHEGAHA